MLQTVLGEKLGAGCSLVSTERCSSRKVIITGGTGLRVRIQKSQKARKKLGEWKRKENLSMVLYDIEKQVQKGSAGLLCPVPCY